MVQYYRTFCALSQEHYAVSEDGALQEHDAVAITDGMSAQQRNAAEKMRHEAAYPLAALRQDKYFSPVARIDNVYGDRNLVCACPSIEDYR